MSKPKYRFYATLLDAFKWYLVSESENSTQDLINKINRVPIADEKSLERMNKGTALNNVIDNCLSCNSEIELEQAVVCDGFAFNKEIVVDILNRLYGSAIQYRTSTVVETKYGLVEVYGVIDYLSAWKCIDLKTTSQYDLGKYVNGMQRHVYNVSLADEGIKTEEFEFLVTDFKSVYSEPYNVDYGESKLIVIDCCESLIEFIEANRHLITDTKIYQLEKVENGF